MAEEPIQEPEPKKRGWPKGKPRGPRKPKPPAPEPTPPFPQQPEAPPDPSQVVGVRATLVGGIAVAFRAMRFDVENGRYSFTSYPPMRGFKTVTVLRADQLAMLEITAPEDMMEKLKAAPAVVYAPTAAVAAEQGPPIVYGPPLQRPPYDGGDPRRPVRDARAEHASNLPNPAGIPMAQLSKGEDGVPDRTMATMG